ncbi:MAG: DnaJ C-terminal domain-containing protein [Planctomycetaceae bacterium]
MPADDYYKTLEVKREASEAEIRKAYKKLARKYHPDTRPDDKDAAEKFKKIQEAYGVLGNAEKREQYDRYGTTFDSAGRGPFRQGWSGRPGGGGAGPIDISDLFGGQIDLGDLFGGATGRRGAGRSPFGQQGGDAPHRGQDVQIDVTVPFQIAALGGNHPIQLRRDDKVDRFTIKIPAGVEDGSVIRLAGQGQPSIGSGKPGDLLVTVKVAPHPYFRREGANLLLDVPITPTEGVLGAKVQVPTLDEGNVSLTIPPGTSSGMKLRLRGKGVVNPKTKERGDQFVVVKIVVPAKPDDATRALYQQLSEIDQPSPRAGLW